MIIHATNTDTQHTAFVDVKIPRIFYEARHELEPGQQLDIACAGGDVEIVTSRSVTYTVTTGKDQEHERSRSEQKGNARRRG